MHIKEETIAILKQFDIGDKFSHLPGFPKASVLIPLFVKDGQLCALLTLRSQKVTQGPDNCVEDKAFSSSCFD